MMQLCARVFILCGVAVFGLCPAVAQADVWMCAQEDGSYLFTDHSVSYCRMVQKDKAQEQKAEAVNKAGREAVSVPAVRTVGGESQTSVPAQSVKAPPAFLAAVQRLPILMVNQLSAKQESQGFYAVSRGELALVDLAVSYVPSGTGPEVSADSHFGGNLDASLRAAVSAAAKAVGYDPRFLRVRLSVKTNILQSGLYIDGHSAGVVFAVGVAASLMGDQIRPDVCMSGTINEDLEVGPVGGLEEKIKGCRQFNYREMVIPQAQTSMDLALKGKGSGIRITEVSTFDAAYQVATGQATRPATLP